MTTAREDFERRIHEDTGFLCRHVLGYNYDEGPGGERVNVGEGGVRQYGPHQEIVEFLDAQNVGFLHLEAPRGTYKSTILGGFCIRHLMNNPNGRILYGMHRQGKIKEKSKQIKTHLESNETLHKYVGKNWVGDPWNQLEWTVMRRSHAIAEPSFSGFSVDASQTGGHYTLIIFDDLIDEKRARTATGLELVNEIFRSTFPMVNGKATLFINCGTVYRPGDVHDLCKDNIHFKKLILDSGCDAKEDDSGQRVVVGVPRFPHEDVEFLQRQLDGMDYVKWQAQYNNRHVSGIVQEFRRHYLRPTRFGTELAQQLTGWIFSDTATSRNEEACHSVIGYAGVDHDRNWYIVDLAVGHWAPDQLVENWYRMRQKWARTIYHGGELMEQTTANDVFRGNLKRRGDELGFKMNLQYLPRSGGELGKPERIRRIQPLMAQGKLFVCNTVPTHFVDVSRQKLLWNPEGWTDHETGQKQPSGELVDQFVQFPTWTRMDIADAICDLEAQDRDGKYYAYHVPEHTRVRRPNMMPPTREELMTLETYQLGYPFNMPPQPAASEHRDVWDRFEIGPGSDFFDRVRIGDG